MPLFLREIFTTAPQPSPRARKAPQEPSSPSLCAIRPLYSTHCHACEMCYTYYEWEKHALRATDMHVRSAVFHHKCCTKHFALCHESVKCKEGSIRSTGKEERGKAFRCRSGGSVVYGERWVVGGMKVKADHYQKLIS